jgi:tetratricopeptide (TPR) repeat protein
MWSPEVTKFVTVVFGLSHMKLHIKIFMKKYTYFLAVVIIISAGCSQSAQKYLMKGKEKYGFQDYNGAISACTKALEIDGDLAEAYYYRGLAKKAYNQNCVGISYNPQGTDLKIGDTTKVAVGLKALQNGQGMKLSYENALRNNAEDIIRIKKGNKKFSLRPWSGEIADFTIAIALDPGYADAFYSRAMSNIRFGQRDSACSDWQIAVALGRTDALDQIQINCR